MSKINQTYVEVRSFTERIILASIIFFMVGIVIFAQVFSLQVLNFDSYESAALNNKTETLAIQPLRGIIYDRNNNILVNNIPSFDLIIVPSRIKNLDELLEHISSFINLEDLKIEDFRLQFSEAKKFNRELTLKRNITEEEKIKFAVRGHLFEAVFVEQRYLRNSLYPELFSHALGYVGNPSEEKLTSLRTQLSSLNNIEQTYTSGLIEGKIGAENIYDTFLSGEFGTKQREVDARGRTLSEEIVSSPKMGSDLYTSLDLASHQAAFSAMQGRRGAIVAVDIQTGSIVTLFSSPTFSSNKLSNGISQDEFKTLIESPDKPFFDRAMRGRYPPASAIKPAIAIYGLDNRLIDWKFSIEDPGFFVLPEDGRIYRDWKEGGHGETNLFKAITQSSNTYFFELAYRSDIESLKDYFKDFGLGKKACLDCFNEDSVFVPEPEWKIKEHNFGWFKGDTVNLGVGQGYLIATPIQLAKYAYILANKGAHKDLSLTFDSTKDLKELELRNLSQDDWSKIHESMVNVIEGDTGTARRLKNLKTFTVAAKTGTAELVSLESKEDYEETRLDSNLRDHAVIIAFGPMPNPRYAVSVVVENGESGGSVAGPIAIDVLEALIK